MLFLIHSPDHSPKHLCFIPEGREYMPRLLLAQNLDGQQHIAINIQMLTNILLVFTIIDSFHINGQIVLIILRKVELLG